MSEESFILLSLKESKAKRLAQVISNVSARKILDYLAKKEATESDLAEKLKIPLSTVHYNIKHLVTNNLVLADEFHYSDRGREVVHYKLANKLIVIAPKEMDESTFSKALKSVLPLSALVLVSTVFLYLFSGRMGSSTNFMSQSADFAAKSAPLMAEHAVMDSAVQSGVKMASEPAVMLANASNATATMVTPVATPPPVVGIVSHSTFGTPALWFLLGAILATLFILIFLYIKDKKSS